MKRMSRLAIAAALLSCVGLPIFGSAQAEAPAAGPQAEIVVKLMRGEHPSSPIKPGSPTFEEIRRLTGVKLEIEAVPQNDYATKASLLMATGQVPDIMYVELAQLNDIGGAGIFLPLLDRIRRDAPNLKKLLDTVPEYMKMTIDGELYYAPMVFANKKKNGRVPMIRKDVLDELKIPMPDTHVELVAALRAMKKAYPASYPWTNRNKTANLLTSVAWPMGGGYDITFDPYVGGGKWVYGTVIPETKQVLATLNQLYKEQVLDPDFAVNTADQWHQKLGSGKSFFYTDNITFALNYNKSLRQTNPKAGFVPMPIMANTYGQRRTFYYPEQHLNYGWAIGAKTKHAERIMKLFDWACSQEGYGVTNYGIEGTHFTVQNGTYVVAKSVLDQFRSASDPMRAMSSALGTNMLQFCIHVDMNQNYLYDPPDMNPWYDQLAADKGMLEPAKEPPFNAAERDRLKVLKTNVNQYLAPALDQLIIGTMPIAEFDAVAAKARQIGATEIEAIYNAAEARLSAKR